MKKFKLKKSVNEESLQPIVKVTQDEENKDKHYFDKSKWGLINYLKSEAKEGRVKLYESGNIAEEDGLKHIIISPCKISRWEKMNNEEKLQIRDSFISKLEQDFNSKNYLIAIEEKPRKGVLMEHYHLVISSKIPTEKAFKVNYKKALMTNYIENFTHKDTRVKLGVKTFNEIKENKVLKIKDFYEKKKESMIAKDGIDTLYAISKGIFENKSDCLKFNRTQKYYILQHKNNLLTDVFSIRQSMSKTLIHIQTINDSIKNIKVYKNSLSKQYLRELSTYRNNCFNSLKDFTLYSKYEHSFFTKLQQHKLKNGTITQENFLVSIARSKSYWKDKESRKRRMVEHDLALRQEFTNKQIRNIEFEIISLLDNKENQKLINTHFKSTINIKKYLLSKNSLQKATQEEILSKKLDIFSQYFKFIQHEIKSKKGNLKTSQDFDQPSLQ